ncbi:MAG: PIN domain-containing protein [Magnetococcales bacterium]|uniref:PIN domain-containing protein n=1 Tax=Candidatus Magnetobacterium casense TaxID=1455061 RepID=A0ABS6RYI3_9BACT|nr:PIN domain-containing protein [Candidatus Magnetobacterium casensis]MBF0607094.1 PIN domain-containing protein [Nitrospirota bacterium]MBV6341094.1 PIN domain-containing protein [Candidatus Magnetobacterium casensis]
MQGGKTFIDTNILVYAYDKTSGAKYTKALEIIEGLWMSGNGVISTQVLQEFYVTITRKIATPVGVLHAKEIIMDYLEWKTIIVDGEIILNAIDIQGKYKYSFWDSVIISSALKAEASLLLTEDLSNGQNIKNTGIRNPFVS